MSFFINLKMKQACKLLRTTDLYIYEIAHELGYTDPYYFSRQFKKTVGVVSIRFYNGLKPTVSIPAVCPV
ncbi:MAG: AraC family transcriptional regulator [Lachnospiraceae bacterium]|nr:AraC family transcriptional regulator [Lachnospiraceae bacterium]